MERLKEEVDNFKLLKKEVPKQLVEELAKLEGGGGDS